MTTMRVVVLLGYLVGFTAANVAVDIYGNPCLPGGTLPPNGLPVGAQVGIGVGVAAGAAVAGTVAAMETDKNLRHDTENTAEKALNATERVFKTRHVNGTFEFDLNLSSKLNLSAREFIEKPAVRSHLTASIAKQLGVPAQWVNAKPTLIQDTSEVDTTRRLSTQAKVKEDVVVTLPPMLDAFTEPDLKDQISKLGPKIASAAEANAEDWVTKPAASTEAAPDSNDAGMANNMVDDVASLTGDNMPQKLAAKQSTPKAVTEFAPKAFAPKAFAAKAALAPALAAAATPRPFDLSSGSSDRLSMWSNSESLNRGSSSASGSSGFYMQLLWWILVVVLLAGCIAFVFLMPKQGKRKRGTTVKREVSRTSPVEAPAPAPAPAQEPEASFRPLPIMPPQLLAPFMAPLATANNAGRGYAPTYAPLSTATTATSYAPSYTPSYTSSVSVSDVSSSYAVPMVAAPQVYSPQRLPAFPSAVPVTTNPVTTLRSQPQYSQVPVVAEVVAAPRPGMWGSITDVLFGAIDRNHDGVISRDEFRQALRENIVSSGP